MHPTRSPGLLQTRGEMKKTRRFFVKPTPWVKNAFPLPSTADRRRASGELPVPRVWANLRHRVSAGRALARLGSAQKTTCLQSVRERRRLRWAQRARVRARLGDEPASGGVSPRRAACPPVWA